MDRALQTQLDRNYRYQRHIYDLTREYYLLGRDRLIDRLDPPIRGTVLEIGSGTARNLIRIAHKYPSADLYGIDLSELMIATAQGKLERNGLRGRIQLKHGDATSFDPVVLFGRKSFDRIVVSYTLSMIPQWTAVLDHALTLMASGSAMHIVDFGTGTGLPRAFNACLRGWLAQFHVTPRDDLAKVLHDLAQKHSAELSVGPLWRSYAISAQLTLR